MKKVLIISYYWPPAGGIAVQRITKFCKYLGDFQWEPIVLTVKHGNYESTDHSLVGDVKHLKHIYRTASIEPHMLYNKIGSFLRTNKNPPRQISGETKPKRSRFAIFAEYVRLNLFIPDARIGWLHNAKQCGIQIINKHKPDLIFSTAPPYTPHLIAMSLHNYSGIPWVADFRDPWVENTLYNTVKRLRVVKNINRYLERKVITRANALTFTGPKLRDHYIESTGIDFTHKATVITNGYDPDDIPNTTSENINKFYVTYFGSLYFQRFQADLFETLAQLIHSRQELQDNLCVRFIGKVDGELKQHLSTIIPARNIEFSDYIPYKEAIKLLHHPQLLLLTIDNVPNNNNITLGKVFDYLPTGNPILGVGPSDGDTAEILLRTKTGKVFEYDDKQSIASYILEKYAAWEEGKLKQTELDLNKFHRKTLTKHLSMVFDDLVKNQKLT